MKILFIRNAFTYDFGGAERLAVHMAQELREHKIDALVLSRQPRLLAYAEGKNVPHRKGWWWSRQDWSGKNLILLPVYLLWQLLLTLWYLQLIVRLKVDAVHAISKDDFIAASIAARLLRKPVIWTDAADLKYACKNLHVWYKNPVGKLVFAASKLAKRVILVSNNEKKLIEESIGRPVPDHWVVIHTAGKDEQVTPLVRDKADKDAVIFCSTSRLVVAKGIGELIAAFNKLSEPSGKYRLWLVGDGPDEALFKTQANGNRHIVFLGHQEKPLPYLAASDIFVQPTYNEAFSLSLAEAAMLGKPMVATEIGGNPELVNSNNGVLVPVKDVDSLYTAMKYLGENASLRTKLGEQARKDYKIFDFSHVIKTRYIPLYETITKA